MKLGRIFFYPVMIFLIIVMTTPSIASETKNKLKEASKQNAIVHMIISTENSEIGLEDVWGAKLDFIIKRPASEVYTALKQINLYPKYIKKIKESKVLFSSNHKIIIKYTASSWGLSITSTQEWTFKNNTLTMKTIGEDDKKIYLKIFIDQLSNHAYSKVYITGYLQMPWIPNLMMDMSESFIEEHAAQQTRKLVNDILPR